MESSASKTTTTSLVRFSIGESERQEQRYHDERFVERFLFEMVARHEDQIYRRWTQWYPQPNRSTFYDQIHFLLDTLLYEPIEFSISESTNTLEFWSTKDKQTLSIDITILERTFVDQFLLPMIHEETWKRFFEQRVVEISNGHKMRYNSFRYNRVLERNFLRGRTVHVLLTKLLFRSVCFVNDGGYVFTEVVYGLLSVVQNMHEGHWRRTDLLLDSLRGKLRFLNEYDENDPRLVGGIGLLLNEVAVYQFLYSLYQWLSQEDLYVRIYATLSRRYFSTSSTAGGAAGSASNRLAGGHIPAAIKQ